MRKILLASVAALGTTAAATAQEDTSTGVYAGIGASVIAFDTDVGDVTLGGANLVGGYNFTENFGVEVEGTFGIADDELLGVDVGLDYLVAAYFVARIPVGESGSNIYGRLGYGTAEFDVAGTGVTSDGFAAGVGGEWTPDGANFVRFDLTALDEDTAQVGAFYVRRF